MQGPIKILIVDDIESNRTALEALLRRPEVEIVHAESGRSALEALLEHDFGLAILDVNMPEMDGFELAELMRGSARTSHIPVLFLTAAGHDAHRNFQGYQVGAVDFLYKPIDPAILSAKVDVFVQLAQHKRQLAEQVERMRELLQANEMLMAVLAHDLRTPLSAINMSAVYIERFPSNEQKVCEAADRILRSGKRMARMVDQLLHMARIHGGQIQLELRQADALEVCNAIADEVQGHAREQRIKVQTRGDTRATFDSGLMSQVLSNLVGNAIKHGDPSEPVSVVVDGSHAAHIEILVHNEGVIPEELLPHVFDAYRSGHATERSEGLGLGLYITRRLVGLHGGDINVESSERLGTRFTIRLPRSTPARRESAKHLA
ncbi:hybrid sensor histidine kinase/response regulator [Ralstonia pickettii]|uniref:hybrid sensor histidine kinase/response regulator n=1 Tax=Ralstonia pickettii TaxID=329 RepID=UPI002714BEBB|nr:hybrid sensor histidine kinase/response regulator [Ralstonia pickettii]WKZ86970.1 hybrid sensor histidine kinase/response regulator [Ralstonia pickettii]